MSSENVSAEQLRQFIERIERLEDDKQGIADEIKDTYSEAKGTGFDTATMRAIIKLRKMERATREEKEALLDVYKTALGLDDHVPGNREISAAASRRDEKVDALREQLLHELRLTPGSTAIKLAELYLDRHSKTLTLVDVRTHLSALEHDGKVRVVPGGHAAMQRWAVA